MHILTVNVVPTIVMRVKDQVLAMAQSGVVINAEYCVRQLAAT